MAWWDVRGNRALEKERRREGEDLTEGALGHQS